MNRLLLTKIRRNAQKARGVAYSQCLFAALQVATYRKPASAVVAEVEVAHEYFQAAVELEGGVAWPA